jgi:hypothetical protein
VDLARSAAGVVEGEGVGAAGDRNPVAFAGKADIPVGESVAVPHHQPVPGGLVAVMNGEGEDDVIAGTNVEFEAVFSQGNGVVAAPGLGALFGLADRWMAEITGEGERHAWSSFLRVSNATVTLRPEPG